MLGWKARSRLSERGRSGLEPRLSEAKSWVKRPKNDSLLPQAGAQRSGAATKKQQPAQRCGSCPHRLGNQNLRNFQALTVALCRMRRSMGCLKADAALAAARRASRCAYGSGSSGRCLSRACSLCKATIPLRFCKSCRPSLEFRSISSINCRLFLSSANSAVAT